MPEDLLDISLEEVVFAIDWEPAMKEILPDNPSPAVDKSLQNIVEPVLDVEPEKEKPSVQIQMSEILCSWTSEEEANQEAQDPHPEHDQGRN